MSPEKSATKTKIHWANFATLLVLFVFYFGEQEPFYLGWRFYIVFSSLGHLLLGCTALYILYNVIRANYAAAELSLQLPKLTQVIFGIFATTSIIILVVGVIGSLVYDSLVWNAARHCATLYIVVFGGTFMLYSLFKLRAVIYSTYQNLFMMPDIEEPEIEMNSRPIINKAATVGEIDNETSQSSFKITAGLELKESLMDQKQVGSSRGMTLRRHVSKAERIQQIRTKVVLKKLNVLMITFPIVLLFSTAVLLYYIISQLTSNEAFSAQTDKDATQLHIFEEFADAIRLSLVILYQYYSYVRFPQAVRCKNLPCCPPEGLARIESKRTSSGFNATIDERPGSEYLVEPEG